MNDIDIEYLSAVAREAGAAILEVYGEDFAVTSKADASPLTEADLRAHRIIVARLEERYPQIPVLSEESTDGADYEVRRHWRRYFLVDPLDGTKEFVKRNGQFTVNIALIEAGRPTAGVVFAPVLDWLYQASEAGAFKIEEGGEPRKLNPPGPRDSKKLIIVGSRSHPTPEMDAWVAEQRGIYNEVEFLAMGSSLKLCILAEGKADVYPRLGPTMEWDTAAAHAVVLGSGRRVCCWGSDQELPYNKPDLLNGWFLGA